MSNTSLRSHEASALSPPPVASNTGKLLHLPRDSFSLFPKPIFLHGTQKDYIVGPLPTGTYMQPDQDSSADCSSLCRIPVCSCYRPQARPRRVRSSLGPTQRSSHIGNRHSQMRLTAAQAMHSCWPQTPLWPVDRPCVAPL